MSMTRQESTSFAYTRCPLFQFTKIQSYSRNEIDRDMHKVQTRCSLSASLYIAFAEHGAGRPGWFFCHCWIHPFLVVGAAAAAGTSSDGCEDFPLFIWLSPGLWAVAGGEDDGSPVVPSACADAMKEDVRGAKMMLSVYICTQVIDGPTHVKGRWITDIV